MRLAALLLVHQYPQQVAKLIDSLLDHQIDVFVHVDIRATETFNKLKAVYSNNSKVVFVSKRYKVFWGSFNQVRATLELLKEAKKTFSYDYYSLLSGQDLPIKALKEFKTFLTENKGKEFLAWYKLPHYENHGVTGGMDRMEYYWLDLNPKHKYFNARLTHLIRKTQDVLGAKRKLAFELYSGSQWFTLSDAAVSYCLDHLYRNPSFLKRFKLSRCADEIFFQTLLLNSPLKENVVNDSLRYIDWKSGPEYPKTLRSEDVPLFVNSSNKFFGRKFDEKTDPAVIEKLISLQKQ